MKTTIAIILLLLLVSCTSTENIRKLDRQFSMNRTQIARAKQDIDNDYPLTHAQYITVKKLSQGSMTASHALLAEDFAKLTAISEEFGKRAQRFLSSIEQQKRSWGGKRRITAKDPNWENLQQFKEYSKPEFKELSLLYKNYKKYKNSFVQSLKNRELVAYTRQLPGNKWQVRQILQEWEREKNYEKYNEAILNDLKMSVRTTATDFKSLVKLSQYLKQTRNRRRQYGQFPRGMSGLSAETQRQATEIISSVIDTNIVVAAQAFSATQNSLADVSKNLVPIRNGQFSDLDQYMSVNNRKMVDDIFIRRKTEILENDIKQSKHELRNILSQVNPSGDKLFDIKYLSNRFNNTHSKVINEPIVKSFCDELQTQRINLIETLENQIMDQIRFAKTVPEIKSPLFDMIDQEDQNLEVIARIQQAKKKKFDSLTAFTPVASVDQLTIRSFTAKGLNFESELMAIFLGDFDHARLKPGDTLTSSLLTKYLYAYGQQCDAYLPANKVAITESVCAEEQVTRNGYGIEVDRSCVRWIQKPTGLYADPVLYSVSNNLQRSAGMNMVGSFFSGDPFAARTIADDIMAIGNDMDNLINKNKCSNAGLKRFEVNLTNFVLNRQPLLLPGKETLAMVYNNQSVNMKADNLNLSALLNDLIAENARGWMMNQYLLNSVSNIQVTSKSRSGSPESVKASYYFKNFGKRYHGDVLLNFRDNLPECLYFSDAPQTCRHPSRGVINKYQRGGYVK